MLDLQLAIADFEQHSIIDSMLDPWELGHLAWEPIPHSTTDSKPLNFGSIENSHNYCNFDVTAVIALLVRPVAPHLHYR